MWNGFIGRNIAATTKNVRRIGFGLLLAASALGVLIARQLVNVMRGPVQSNEMRLAAITDQKYLWRDYVAIQGTNTVSTGITQVEKPAATARWSLRELRLSTWL